MSSNTSSNSSSKANLSGALSLLNIDSNESSNNEEKEAANVEIINTATKCAACGKEGDGDSMNSCNKCDLVKYCNAACKKRHKSKHKKACERRVAELYDEKLFKEPLPPEECPICMLPLPLDGNQTTFNTCCGKLICNGCEYTITEKEGFNVLCAFCRTPVAKSEKEYVKRNKLLMEKGNARAFNLLARCYAHGRMGMPQDRAKENELNLKAGELGYALAYYNLGNAYSNGRGVEIDMKKAQHYWELAAMNGNVYARYYLGALEGRSSNERATKHFILAARAGHEEALGMIKQGFMGGVVTKDEYAKTLRAYQESKDEMKSEARDKAAAIRGHRSAS